MNRIQRTRLLSLLLCVVLVAAMALFASGCGTVKTVEPAVTEVPVTEQPKVDFSFSVIHRDGTQKDFAISTAAGNVGEALLAEGLIAGEDSEYGLYVKTVDGELADYDTDGSYWAFYINGEYAMTGVSATPVEAGATYTFAVEGITAEPAEEGTVVGEGAVSFTFIVRDAEGTETVFTVKTDSQTVGAALLENDLIAGVESEYGLYVKEVMGIVADYDVDQSYWAFYINGEYAMTGVDSTDIEAGAVYTFAVEK